MAAINQITIAGGSTYDVNDKRITTSAVSTATHFLATDSSISSIAPITASNLASVLGGLIINKTAIVGNDANNFETGTGYRLTGGLNVAHKPSNSNRMVIYTYAQDSAASVSKFQIACIADGSIAAREYNNDGWGDWSMTPSYLNAYPNLSSLASALGVYKLDENPNFSDLNDAVGVTQGITYYFFSPSVAPQNLPSEISTTTRFFLEVINSTGKPNSYDIIQRITNRSSNVMYQRYRTGTSWSEWGRL